MDWPRPWLELYARQGFAADDIVASEAARTSEPFTWSEIRSRCPGASERIFRAAADFGWTDGFVIPVHDPGREAGERFGLVSLAGAALPVFAEPFRSHVVTLSLTAFARARDLDRSLLDLDLVPVELSYREREVLQLVADGLSDAQIADALGFSIPTANFHVASVKQRLNAKSRAQAVAIALTRNLV